MEKSPLTLLKVSEIKISEFAHSIDLDGVAHNEPPHIDLRATDNFLGNWVFYASK